MAPAPRILSMVKGPIFCPTCMANLVLQRARFTGSWRRPRRQRQRSSASALRHPGVNGYFLEVLEPPEHFRHGPGKWSPPPAPVQGENVLPKPVSNPVAFQESQHFFGLTVGQV